MVDVNLKVPALEKLLDYVASGIGAVGGPMLARWKARADTDAIRISAQGKADSMRLIAKAQAEARNNFAGGELSTRGELSVDREIKARLDFQEEKRLRNIGAVVGMSADDLKEKEVEDRDVDHDWVARFFADVQDVTSEKMQEIWSKILAGEVEAPGRTSLHTLAILKNMTQEDAELFETVSSFIFDEYVFGGKIGPISMQKIISGYPDYNSLIKLQSYGLLVVDVNAARIYDLKSNSHIIVRDSKTVYRISGENGGEYLSFRCCPLSPQGKELYNMTESVVNENYLKEIVKFLKEEGNLKLERALILEELVNDQVRVESWELVSS